MSINKEATFAAVATILVLALQGCGNKEAGIETKPAARVNGQVIAAAEIDAEMARIAKVPPDQAQGMANRILKNAVDQELFAQKAVQSKLDKQPDVQIRIAAARRQILADAQIAALTQGIGEPSDAEVKAYYEAHPELFAQRSIYRLQELLAGTTPDDVQQAQEAAAKARSARELATALQAMGIPVGAREVVKGAEDLPFELLAKLSAMRVGESITTVQNGKLNVVIIADVEQRPLTMADATPAIKRYLLNKNKRDMVEAELKKLDAGAKIEYDPPYAAIQDMGTNQAKP